jgi:hypothetical protein
VNNTEFVEISMSGTGYYLKYMTELVFPISEGSYPLPEVISVVHDGATFTFTPIPVYW